MPAQSYAPQSIGRNQLNILAGPFDERSVRKTLKAAVPANADETIYAGRVCHENAAGLIALGLEAVASPVSLPLFSFTNANEPNTRRDNLDADNNVNLGMMAGGTVTCFRHNAPNELATTEFVGLSSDPVGTPLTAYNTVATSDADAANNGKLRKAVGDEPVVAYLTRKAAKGAEGHTMIAFTPAWTKGDYVTS